MYDKIHYNTKKKKKKVSDVLNVYLSEYKIAEERSL